MDEQLIKLIKEYTKLVALAISKTKQHNDIKYVDFVINDIKRMLMSFDSKHSNGMEGIKKYLNGMLDELNEVKQMQLV